MTGWNMPPGCNVSDIPGNRPEDLEAEALADFSYDRFARATEVLITRQSVLCDDTSEELCDETKEQALETALEVLHEKFGKQLMGRVLSRYGYMAREPETFYPGDILKNGATVLGYKRFEDKRVVLAKAPGELSALPYVTWRMNEQGECYWGHYYKTEAEAAVDFVGRK